VHTDVIQPAEEFRVRLVLLVKDKIGKLYEVEVDLSGKVVSGLRESKQ